MNKVEALSLISQITLNLKEKHFCYEVIMSYSNSYKMKY